MDIVTFEEYKTKVDELEEQVRNHDESIRKLTGIVSYLLGEVERRGVGTYRGQPVPVPEPDPEPDADPVPEPEPEPDAAPVPEPEPLPEFPEPDQAAVSAADMKSYIQRMAESGQIANVLSPDGSLPRDLGVTGKGEYVPLHPVPEPDPEPGGRVYILPKGGEKIRFRRLLSSHRPHPSGGGKKKKNVSKTRKKKSRKRKSHNRIKKYKRRLK